MKKRLISKYLKGKSFNFTPIKRGKDVAYVKSHTVNGEERIFIDNDGYYNLYDSNGNVIGRDDNRDVYFWEAPKKKVTRQSTPEITVVGDKSKQYQKEEAGPSGIQRAPDDKVAADFARLRADAIAAQGGDMSKLMALLMAIGVTPAALTAAPFTTVEAASALKPGSSLWLAAKPFLASMAAGEAANGVSELATGRSWGENVGDALQQTTGWNPRTGWFGELATDLTNPYYFTPSSLVEKAVSKVGNSIGNRINSDGWIRIGNYQYRPRLTAGSGPNFQFDSRRIATGREAESALNSGRVPESSMLRDATEQGVRSTTSSRPRISEEEMIERYYNPMIADINSGSPQHLYYIYETPFGGRQRVISEELHNLSAFLSARPLPPGTRVEYGGDNRGVVVVQDNQPAASRIVTRSDSEVPSSSLQAEAPHGNELPSPPQEITIDPNIFDERLQLENELQQIANGNTDNYLVSLDTGLLVEREALEDIPESTLRSSFRTLLPGDRVVRGMYRGIGLGQALFIDSDLVIRPSRIEPIVVPNRGNISQTTSANIPLVDSPVGQQTVDEVLLRRSRIIDDINNNRLMAYVNTNTGKVYTDNILQNMPPDARSTFMQSVRPLRSNESVTLDSDGRIILNLSRPIAADTSPGTRDVLASSFGETLFFDPVTNRVYLRSEVVKRPDGLNFLEVSPETRVIYDPEINGYRLSRNSPSTPSKPVSPEVVQDILKNLYKRQTIGTKDNRLVLGADIARLVAELDARTGLYGNPYRRILVDDGVFIKDANGVSGKDFYTPEELASAREKFSITRRNGNSGSNFGKYKYINKVGGDLDKNSPLSLIGEEFGFRKGSLGFGYKRIYVDLFGKPIEIDEYGNPIIHRSGLAGDLPNSSPEIVTVKTDANGNMLRESSYFNGDEPAIDTEVRPGRTYVRDENGEIVYKTTSDGKRVPETKVLDLSIDTQPSGSGIYHSTYGLYSPDSLRMSTNNVIRELLSDPELKITRSGAMVDDRFAVHTYWDYLTPEDLQSSKNFAAKVKTNEERLSELLSRDFNNLDDNVIKAEIEKLNLPEGSSKEDVVKALREELSERQKFKKAYDPNSLYENDNFITEYGQDYDEPWRGWMTRGVNPAKGTTYFVERDPLSRKITGKTKLYDFRPLKEAERVERYNQSLRSPSLLRKLQKLGLSPEEFDAQLFDKRYINGESVLVNQRGEMYAVLPGKKVPTIDKSKIRVLDDGRVMYDNEEIYNPQTAQMGFFYHTISKKHGGKLWKQLKQKQFIKKINNNY